MKIYGITLFSKRCEPDTRRRSASRARRRPADGVVQMARSSAWLVRA